jgi:hypothetical protein
MQYMATLPSTNNPCNEGAQQYLDSYCGGGCMTGGGPCCSCGGAPYAPGGGRAKAGGMPGGGMPARSTCSSRQDLPCMLCHAVR